MLGVGRVPDPYVDLNRYLSAVSRDLARLTQEWEAATAAVEAAD